MIDYSDGDEAAVSFLRAILKVDSQQDVLAACVICLS
jgi:hypothetical protein